MSKQEVSAKLSGEGQEAIKVTFDFGDNLEETVKLFGEEVVHGRAKAALVIDLQALVRRMIKAGKDKKEIDATVAKWSPSVSTTVHKTAMEKVQEQTHKLSKEERLALIKQLQAQK